MKDKMKDVFKKPKEYATTRNIIILIAAVVLVILLVIVLNTAITNIKDNKFYEEYKMQMSQIQKQEEEKQAKIEAQKEAQRLAKIPKLTQEGINNMENIYKSENKRVFLTFDDGPSANTPTILDILKEQKVLATFFELGSKVEKSPELVKRAYDEGHYIANHGYSHVYSSIYTSKEEVLKEYTMCNDAVKNAIGVPEYDSHLFRFPGGLPGGPYADIKAEASQLLKENNILNIDWNCLSGDAEGKNLPVERLLSRLEETAGEKNSLVVLMHDSPSKSTTVDALPQIIEFLRNKGYEFVNFYDIIK